jgi:hypothetical protein
MSASAFPFPVPTLPADPSLFTDGNECADDALPSRETLEFELQRVQQQAAALDLGAPVQQRLRLALDGGHLLLDLGRQEEAWQQGWEIFCQAIDAEHWGEAAEACSVLYHAEQPDSIKALAHGIWLGVTYPIDPELSVALLQSLVEETPDNSDGGAVAAATACYLADLRSQGQPRENLLFFTQRLLADVARRHSKVQEQDIFDFWVERLELNDPGKFLPRLAKVLDILTGGAWWYDRDALRARLPED